MARSRYADFHLGSLQAIARQQNTSGSNNGTDMRNHIREKIASTGIASAHSAIA